LQLLDEQPAWRPRALAETGATRGGEKRGGLSRPAEEVRPRQRTSFGPSPALRRDLIYGRNAVLEAARAGRVAKVYISDRAVVDPRLQELRGLGPVREVPVERLETLSQGAHQGVVAELKPRRWMTLGELLARKPQLVVALDGIEDPQNLGAILRSAEAAGCQGVILPAHRAAPLSGTAVKASSGASEHLALCRVPGLPSAIAEVKRAGLWCAALDPRGDLSPWQFDLRQPVCLVVGGEGAGVHRLVRERCDVRLKLPMQGRVASLNASAAAAQLLYEVARQRLQPARA